MLRAAIISFTTALALSSAGSHAATASPAAEPLTMLTPPTVAVFPMVGEQVSLLSFGTWSPAIDENEVLKVEWVRGGVVARTDDTVYGGLDLKPTDVGKSLVARVTVQDAEQAYAATVGESKALTVFPRPAISGEPKVGRTLKVGGWPSYVKAQVRWTRNNTLIPGATSTTYRPVSGDRGKLLAVMVSLTSPGYRATKALTLPRKIR